MKILALISDRVLPATNGSRVRNLNLWRALQLRGAEIKVLGLDPTALGTSVTPQVPDVNSEFIPFNREAFLFRAAKSLLYSYHQWPHSNRLYERVMQIQEEWKPDIIHAEELRMSMYLPAMNGAIVKAKQTVTIHNVESILIKKTGSTAIPFGKQFIEMIHLKNLNSLESQVAKNCDISFAYSAVDQAKYQEIYPRGNWKFTSGGVAINTSSLSEEKVKPNSVLLVGTLNYMPNIEGLYWFTERVLPLLENKISLTVAGSKATEKIRNHLSAKMIPFIDTPNDLTPLYQSHLISIVPLLSGSGTRGRILESMGQGKLVISTSIGAEGLNTREGQGILIGNDPQSFAKQILFALENKSERRKIALSGLDFVRQHYDWSLVAKNLLSHWETIL